jgi:hypothetical protein
MCGVGNAGVDEETKLRGLDFVEIWMCEAQGLSVISLYRVWMWNSVWYLLAASQFWGGC